MGELDAAVVVDLPLRGEWTVERTPAHRIPSHGTDRLGQQFAFDFVRADRRRGLHLHPAGTTRLLILGGRTGDFYGWGQSVHAAFKGEVVRVVDGVPERARVHVVRETWEALRNTFLVARRRLDPARLAGNHVVIRSDAAYALYAHLAPESIPVRMGQRVAAGQEIGRVGHTGYLGFGPQPGIPSPFGVPTTRRTSVPSILILNRSPPRSDAIWPPSGENESSPHLGRRDVIRCRCFPFGRMSPMAPRTPEFSFVWKAIHRPLGDQSGNPQSSFHGVSRRRCVPSSRTVKIAWRPSLFLARWNAIRVRPGDQLGWSSSDGDRVLGSAPT